MLGWWTVITTETLAQRRQPGGGIKEATLATWDSGLGGMDWILELCKQGKAEQHAFNGYPNRFTVAASEVLPILARGIREHLGHFNGPEPSAWKGSVTVHQERIAACAPEQILLVEVWDQS